MTARKGGDAVLAFATGLPKVECVAFTPDGGRVIVGGAAVEMWDRFAGERVWRADSLWAKCLVVAGRRVLADRVFQAQQIEADTGGRLAELLSAFGDSRPTVLAVHPPTGDTFQALGPALARATVGWTKSVVWRLETPAVETLGMAADGANDCLVTHELHGTRRAAFVVRDAATGEEIARGRCLVNGQFDQLLVSPGGTWLVARRKHQAWAWPTAAFRDGPIPLPVEDEKHLTGMAFHPAGRYLATASNEGTVRFWSVGDWRPGPVYHWDAGRMRSIAFSPDGTTAAAGTDGGQVVLFDVDG